MQFLSWLLLKSFNKNHNWTLYQEDKSTSESQTVLPINYILYQVDTSVIALSPNSGQRKQKAQNNQFKKKILQDK